MKTIYLLRHAKSSQKYPEIDDFERPLSKKGRESIAIMGKLLNDLNASPGLIITSPANRAAMTARSIAGMINYQLDKIEYREDIYLSDKDTLLEVIKNVKNSFKSVMLVGHNPGLTELANHLNDEKVEDIPTCGVCCLEFNSRYFRDIAAGSGKMKFFEYPKKQA